MTHGRYVPSSFRESAFSRPCSRVALALAAILFAAPTAAADTSKDLAKLGQKIWPAFSCAAAAARSNNQEEQARLFQIGYDGGKRFLTALSEGKVEQKDVQSSVAIGVTTRLGGPSVDFILGRIWDGAEDDMHNKIKQHCPDCMGSDASSRATAEQMFRQMNCALIQ